MAEVEKLGARMKKTLQENISEYSVCISFRFDKATENQMRQQRFCLLTQIQSLTSDCTPPTLSVGDIQDVTE